MQLLHSTHLQSSHRKFIFRRGAERGNVCELTKTPVVKYNNVQAQAPKDEDLAFTNILMKYTTVICNNSTLG